MSHQHRDRHQPTSTEECWDDFWAPIVAPEGIVNIEMIKDELHDYHAMMQQVPLVYDHVTGGRVSGPLTMAADVISEADNYQREIWDEATKEWEEEASSLQGQIEDLHFDKADLRSRLDYDV